MRARDAAKGKSHRALVLTGSSGRNTHIKQAPSKWSLKISRCCKSLYQEILSLTEGQGNLLEEMTFKLRLKNKLEFSRLRKQFGFLSVKTLKWEISAVCWRVERERPRCAGKVKWTEWKGGALLKRKTEIFVIGVVGGIKEFLK